MTHLGDSGPGSFRDAVTQPNRTIVFEVGGVARVDTDRDGMPDEWERRYGFDAADPEDRNGDRDWDGYTNLEEYLQSLVGEGDGPG